MRRREAVRDHVALGPTGPAGRAGFSLVELMFVVTLLGIIAAMAIPTFQNGRKYSNEASAISSLRIFSSAQVIHRTRFGAYGTLPNMIATGLIDDSFTDGEKSGYRFTMPAVPSPWAWSISAQPITPGVSGDRFFFIDESGVIRFHDGGVATAADAPIQ